MLKKGGGRSDPLLRKIVGEFKKWGKDEGDGGWNPLKTWEEDIEKGLNKPVWELPFDD